MHRDGGRRPRSLRRHRRRRCRAGCVPLLIHLCNSPVPSRGTQKFATEQLASVYIAMAMVSKPGLASFILGLLFKFKKPPIPMKSFTNENEARQWLQQYV